MVILDTHALIWLSYGHNRFGKQALAISDKALLAEKLCISSISYWETAMLVKNKRIGFIADVANWRVSLNSYGIKEIPVSGDIGIMANNLDNFHKDPADQVIVATSIIHNAQLVTADLLILSWKGKLKRHNALK